MREAPIVNYGVQGSELEDSFEGRVNLVWSSS